MPELDRYEQARRRVEGKLGFMSHLAVYILVNALLIVINYLSTPDRLWFFWPLLGWGIGLAFHAMGVFIFSSGSVLKERLIERELQKLDGKPAHPNSAVGEGKARQHGE
jgi:hypothetical protein